MAQYFKKKSGRDNNSDIQHQLPRATRKKNYHELKSGDKPSFLVVARVRSFIAREKMEKFSKVFVQIERMQMKAKNPQTSRKFSLWTAAYQAWEIKMMCGVASEITISLIRLLMGSM